MDRIRWLLHPLTLWGALLRVQAEAEHLRKLAAEAEAEAAQLRTEVARRRPKVGKWHDWETLSALYDDRGLQVANVSESSWFAHREYTERAHGGAASLQEAKAAALAVLRTWCDVTDAEGK